MKRTIALILTVVMMLAGSLGPVAAKDHKPDKDDAKVTAEECKKDGWKDLTNDDGKPFKNQGQCVSYAKQGGELAPIEEDGDTGAVSADATATAATEGDKDPAPSPSTPDPESEQPILKIVDGQEPWNGYLEGSGFTPGEELTKVTFTSNRTTLNVTSPVGTVINDDGTFTTERIIYWCSEFVGYGETVGTVTVEDSSGATFSQTFEMKSHCEAGG